jgi:hypothetical protein
VGDRLAQGLERLVRFLLPLERRRHHPELLDRRRVVARVRQIDGGEVHVEQPFPQLLVIRIELCRFAQHFDRLLLLPFVGELARNLLEIAHRAGLVAHLDAGVGALEARLEVLRIERSQTHLRVQRAAGVALGLPQLDQRVEVGARIRIQLLVAQNLGDLHQRPLVVRFELEDFLENGAGLRAGAFFAEVVGDLEERVDRFVGLARARVQITKRVLGVPVSGRVLDNAQVLRDAGIELPLPDQFLGVAQRQSAIDRH